LPTANRPTPSCTTFELQQLISPAGTNIRD